MSTTIDRYLDKLAEASPIPGGGSAAALVGALGISLLSMVTGYILKRKSGEVPHKRLSEILEFTLASRRCLRRLMDEDEIAYLKLSKGKKELARDISRLYRRATDVPFEVCTILKEAIKSCEELLSYCRGSIVSDLWEAALLLDAAFLSAELNVEINIHGVRDTAYIKKIHNELSRYKIVVSKIKKKIFQREF